MVNYNNKACNNRLAGLLVQD